VTEAELSEVTKGIKQNVTINECEHRCRERSVDSTMFERAGKYDWRTQDLRQS
jgi:hypothetical protein